MNNAEYDVDIIQKIVLIGDSGVGKSNLITRFTKDEFNIESKATIGVECATKVLTVQSSMVKTQIWDTAGQERYRAITHAYYKGAVGAIIVFDISKQESFNNVEKWMKEIQTGAAENIVILLVGNKCDLDEEREVSKGQGQEYAELKGIKYVETSAMTSQNVESAFTDIVNKIYEDHG